MWRLFPSGDLSIYQQVDEHLSDIIAHVSFLSGAKFSHLTLISILLVSSYLLSLTELCILLQSIPEKMKWQDKVTASVKALIGA